MTSHEEKRHILIVEDDTDIAELVQIYLHHQHYSTSVAHTLKDASRLFEEHAPDLILCDIVLPDGLGTDWVQLLREKTELPVIFLSSRQETEDIIQGLEIADDYMTKPFDPDIMVARVKKRIKSSKINPPYSDDSSEKVWRDGWLDIHFDRYEVAVGGNELSLPAKELQLLLLMAGRPGHVFSTDYLFEQIWGLDNWSDVRTVMVHMHHLRRKIENPLDPHRYIVTVRGVGYKFQTRQNRR
ncbi:response regulator transcription factor [Paenibacillus barcinonensis]|uniref:DNA-binding response OmpR family regulator n=1 Tax=Paenibacillus barcinonensis TaxID=198119 RepID=A0A2V4WE23_PAEBA|nr:response regulator transcription factor [Paenibacillus barcinonensis]PYE49743.1 DNA-binding response OmpR family regulator [Paenibacillus barcinonensis]QKS56562.1 response regulator transcription factor [Paenibacillus barcinonensis]